MSKYTTELRFICEQYCIDHYPDIYTVDNISEKSVFEIASVVATDGYLTKYGDSDFIIFDENYRIPLMIKFIMKYYTREIGLETFGLWKSKIRNEFDIIMPYYNELYKSIMLEYNPLWTENYTEKNDGTRDVDGKNENHSGTHKADERDTTNSGNEWSLYSDTPQGGIYGILNAEDQEHVPNLTENGYLTNATHNISNGSQHTEGTEDSTVNQNGKNKVLTTDDYTRTVTGLRGYNVNKLLKDFRDNIINVDEMIIGRFKNYFMLLW